MPPPPSHRTTNGGTTYKLNPASWDGADHDTQMVDHMSPPGDYAARLVGVHIPNIMHTYLGLMRKVSPNLLFGLVRLGFSMSRLLSALQLTQSLYSDERTCEVSLICCQCLWDWFVYPLSDTKQSLGDWHFFTLTLSLRTRSCHVYQSRTPPSAYYQRHPQTPADYSVRPISYSAMPCHSFCPLSGGRIPPVSRHPRIPSPAYLPHPAFYSPIPLLWPAVANWPNHDPPISTPFGTDARFPFT